MDHFCRYRLAANQEQWLLQEAQKGKRLVRPFPWQAAQDDQVAGLRIHPSPRISAHDREGGYIPFRLPAAGQRAAEHRVVRQDYDRALVHRRPPRSRESNMADSVMRMERSLS